MQAMAGWEKVVTHRVDVPEPDCLVIGARRNPLPVGAPGKCGNTSKVSLKCIDQSASQGVPDLDSGIGTLTKKSISCRKSPTDSYYEVRTSTCNHRAIWRELHRRYTTKVSSKDKFLLVIKFLRFGRRLHRRHGRGGPISHIIAYWSECLVAIAHPVFIRPAM